MSEKNVERPFSFLRTNVRQEKPRTQGLTEIRGPYYTPMGPHYLEDVLSTMGEYVDSLKFAAGSFTLMPRTALKSIIDTAHKYDVLVSTGGFIEMVLTQGPEAVEKWNPAHFNRPTLPEKIFALVIFLIAPKNSA